MRVPMKEPVFEDHLHIRAESTNPDLVRVQTHGGYCLRIVDPDPLNKFHYQQLGSGVFPVNLREPYTR